MMADTATVPLTADEISALCRLLHQATMDTLSNTQARLYKRLLKKLDHASLTVPRTGEAAP